MDNKKTFADLFSSSTTTNEQEESNSDRNITNQNDQQFANSKNKEMTFDNLFEQSEEKSEKWDEMSEVKKEVDLNSILNLNDKTLSVDNHQVQEENLFQNKELEPQKMELEKDVSLENPFFEEGKTSEEHSLQGESLFQNKELEPQKMELEKDVSLENPFFEEEKTSEEHSLQGESLFQNKELEKDVSLENPFFEEGKTSEEHSLQGESFFQNKESEPQNKELEKDVSLENPFFEEGKTSEEKKLGEESNDSLSKISNLEKRQDNEKKEVISTSPFFENSVSEEENPLFLNKINLIEHEHHESKIGAIDSKKSKHFNVKVVKKKEPLFRFILGVISYAIFIWLLLIGITLLVYVLDIKIRAAKGDYSSPTFNAYVVLTGSMLPEIQVYDVVITKKINASDLKEGDIITFASADSRFLNTIITHRIIKKNYDADSKTYTFQTKGDNNNVADSALVPQNNIYGKVILKIPKLGYLQEFLASDGGWIIVILIPCLTVISYDIVKLAKGLKRKKYKNIKVQK